MVLKMGTKISAATPMNRMSLRSRAIITMAVVMLSSRAERKKVRMLMTHRSFFLLVVVILSVMTRKP